MNLKLAFRKRAIFLVLSAALVIIVLRLSIRGSGDPWAPYSPHVPLSRRAVSSDTRTILLWTPFFSQSDYIKSTPELGCPELKCEFTSNRSALDRSDAVMFHVRDTQINDLPTFRFPWQRWLLLHHESPEHTPDVFKQLDGQINWTITYRLDSDVLLTPSVKLREHPKSASNTNFAANKTRMVVWFVSNCQTASNREAYVKELQKILPVDVIGSCGGKECLPKMSSKCYEDAAKEYRFYLSFENSICKDYITEKFFHVLTYDIVPVVLGGADYAKMAPPGSYIDAMKFESPRALGKHLLELAKDEEHYNEFFRWKRRYEIVGEHYACTVCRKLHDVTEPPKVWNSLHKWWFGEANCRKWSR